MPRSRVRLVDFETRSVQLIAACTLGLAGLANLPPAASTNGSNAARIAGPHSSSSSSSHSSTAPAVLRPLSRRTGGG